MSTISLFNVKNIREDDSYLWDTAPLPSHLDSFHHMIRPRGDNPQVDIFHNPAGNSSRSILVGKLIKMKKKYGYLIKTPLLYLVKQKPFY